MDAGLQRPFLEYAWFFDQRVLRTAVERAEAVREAIGSSVDMAFDLSCYTDMNTAVQLRRETEHLNVLFIEEPMHPLNVDAMLEIKQKIKVPIATGERLFTRWGYREYFEKHVFQLAQPDMTICGGITEAKRIIDMAELYDIPVQMHICRGPIAVAASLQLEASTPNLLIHETYEGAIKEEIYSQSVYDYTPKNGYVSFPELPCIGQELTEQAMVESIHYIVK